MQIITELASAGELGALMQIENACFPPTERCTPAMMKARLQQFPEWCLTARRGGSIVGFIHGMSIGQPAVQDAFYYIPTQHRPGAPWQCVLGLAVAPAFRGKGAAHSLMQAYAAKARKARKQGIVLACRAEKQAFYEHMGFVCAGISQSRYGGGVWLDMVQRF